MPVTTVVQTTTVAGRPEVRTVTIADAVRNHAARGAADDQPVPRVDGRRRVERPGLQASADRKCGGGSTAPREGGRRPAGVRFAERGLCVVQPRACPLLDRYLRRGGRVTRPLRANPGKTSGDQPPPQGHPQRLQLKHCSIPDTGAATRSDRQRRVSKAHGCRSSGVEASRGDGDPATCGMADAAPSPTATFERPGVRPERR